MFSKFMRTLFLAVLLAMPLQAGAAAPAAAPAAYTAAVQDLHINKYGVNDIRSFVYHIFSLYDYHVPVKDFYPLLVNKGLEMQFPEGKLRSHRDFQHWYDVSVGENIKTNTHTVEKLQVKVLGNHRYQADLVVWWQAETFKGEYLSYRFHQTWTLVEENQNLKIQSYLVEPVK